MSIKTIEDSYCLKDAEHQIGTNKYTFKYNYQWRNITQEHLTVSVRSVKLWKQPRNLWVENLVVHDNDENKDITTGFDISITGSMTEFNNIMNKEMKDEVYRVYYNPKNMRLVFDCEGDRYFKYISPTPPTILTDWSEDFKSITGATNLWVDMKVLDKDANDNPTCFCFENVWNREDVHVRTSFVDLGYKNFLGVSNEQFIPPKEYPVSFTDKKFTVELYDSLDRPIELPEDEKGGLVIEAIMKSAI